MTGQRGRNGSDQQSSQPGTQQGTGMPGPGGRGASARIEKARNPRGTLRRLLATLHPHRGALVGVFLLVAVRTGLALLTPLLIGLAIDRSIATGDLAGLLRTALLMLAAYLGAWLAEVGYGVIMAKVSQRAMRGLRRDLFDRAITEGVAFVPGVAFYPDADEQVGDAITGDRFARLCFTFANTRQIDEGCRRLGRSLDQWFQK